MDKVKVYLAVLQKHHFWVITGVVLLASLVSWFLASSQLTKEFEANKSEIESKISAASSVASLENHPNPTVLAGLEQTNIRHANDVYLAWKHRYEEQLKVPQWPRDDLGDAFVDFIESNSPTAEIPQHFRDVYLNFVNREIDKLFEIIVMREPKELPGGAGQNRGALGGLAGMAGLDAGMGGTASNAAWTGLVAWPGAREYFRMQYEWPNRPTSMQVRYANEDLWVYRALLKIIAATNDGVKDHLNANIKKIDALTIGQNVPPPAQIINLQTNTGGMGGDPSMMGMDGMGMDGMDAGMMPAEGDAGMMPGGDPGMMPGGDPGMMPGDPGMGGMPGEGGMGGMGGMAGNSTQTINARLKHNRYVDAKGKPISYAAAEPYAEFKIMPFQMLLVMDQRKVPELLVACANSPLPVEVRQVGIASFETPPADTSGGAGMGGAMPGMGAGMNEAMPGMGGMGGGLGGMGGMGGGMPGMGGLGGGMPGGMGGGMGGGMPGGMGAAMGSGMPGGSGVGGAVLGGEVELRPFDLQVEVRGVIYIFNKPDRSKVGKQGEAAVVPEGAAAVVPDAAPGAVPADGAPVDGAPAPNNGQPANPDVTAPGVPGNAAPGSAPGNVVPPGDPNAPAGAGAGPAGQQPMAPAGQQPAGQGGATGGGQPAGQLPAGQTPATPPAANPNGAG